MATNNTTDLFQTLIENATTHSAFVVDTTTTTIRHEFIPEGTLARDAISEQIWPYALAAVVVAFVWLVGSTANGIMILTFLTHRGLLVQQPVFLLLLNLSVADFLICFFGTPTMFISAIKRSWAFSQTICDTYGFSMSIAGITNACTLAAIAIQRYRIMRQSVATPARNRRVLELQLSSSSNAGNSGKDSSSLAGSTIQIGNASLAPPPGMLVALVIIWMYSVGVSLPPLLGWSAIVVEGIGFSCAPRWDTRNGGWPVLSYSIFMMFFAFILPCGAVVVCYTMLVRHVKSSSMMSQTNFDQRINRLQRLTAIMILVFLSTWLPYALFSFVVMIGYEEHIPAWLGSLPVIWCKFSIVINPFVYYFTVANLRSAVRKTVNKVFHCCLKKTSFAKEKAQTPKNQKALDVLRKFSSTNSPRATETAGQTLFTSGVSISSGSGVRPSVSIANDGPSAMAEEQPEENDGQVYCGDSAAAAAQEMVELNVPQVPHQTVLLTVEHAARAAAAAKKATEQQAAKPTAPPSTLTTAHLSGSVCDLTKPTSPQKQNFSRRPNSAARPTSFAAAIQPKLEMKQENNDSTFCAHCNNKTPQTSNSSSTPIQRRAYMDSATQSCDEDLSQEQFATMMTPVHSTAAAEKQRRRNRNRNSRRRRSRSRQKTQPLLAEVSTAASSAELNKTDTPTQLYVLRLVTEEEMRLVGGPSGNVNALLSSTSLSSLSLAAAAKLSSSSSSDKAKPSYEQLVLNFDDLKPKQNGEIFGSESQHKQSLQCLLFEDKTPQRQVRYTWV